MKKHDFSTVQNFFIYYFRAGTFYGNGRGLQMMRKSKEIQKQHKLDFENTSSEGSKWNNWKTVKKVR